MNSPILARRFSNRSFNVVVFTALLIFTKQAVAQTSGMADLDPTFRQVFSLNGAAGSSRGKISFLANAPEGKIVVAGDFNVVGTANRASLVRLNQDGSVDESFKPTIGILFPTGIAVQPDGRIILAASNLNGSGYQMTAGLIRLNVDGSLDHSYDLQGGGIPSPTPLALQPDGKLLVTIIGSGQFVRRFNANGSVDSGFQANLAEAPKQILAHPDGGIILRFGGTDSTSFIGAIHPGTVVRLQSNGANDSEFTPFAASLGPIALEPGNRIIVPYGCFNLIGSSIWQAIGLPSKNKNAGIPYSPCSVASWDSNPVGPYSTLIDRTVFSPGSGVAQARMTSALLQVVQRELNTFGATAILQQPDGAIVIAGNGLLIRAKFSSPALPQSPLGVSSAANFKPEIAAGSLVAVFGKGLAASTILARPPSTTIGDTRAILISADGTDKELTLLFVSDEQINAHIPEPFPNGQATLLVTRGVQAIGSTIVNVRRIAPGIFTASGTGRGYAAAQIFRVRADGSRGYEPVVTRDASGQIVPHPIDLGPEGELVYLVLYATGVRHHSGNWTSPGNAVKAEINLPSGVINAIVAYAGEAPGLLGVDQINILIPRSLKGINNDVTFGLTVDGLPATALVRIQ